MAGPLGVEDAGDLSESQARAPGGQQIFLNVRGIALDGDAGVSAHANRVLLRVEAHALAGDAAAVQAFLRAVRFPR